jgi:hypothetical protein
MKLAQTGSEKADSTIMSSLLGENVTLGALKNLVTDKPAPITMKLAQTGSEKADSTIMSSLLGENVTLGALKNLVTDKPAPITMKLAQIEKSDADKNLNLAQMQGPPVYVKPESMLKEDTMANARLGL